MLKKIEINNLKSIDHLEVELSDLNLFVGANSSGKSTILQGLLFVAQNTEEAVGLNGDFVKLGDLEENCCIYRTGKEISVQIFMDNRYIRKQIVRDAETSKLRMLTRQSSGTEQTWRNIFNIRNRQIQYLSCHRIGPLNLYEKNMGLDDTIDSNGNFAMSYLNSHGRDPIEQSLCRGSQDFTLLGQVNWWLNYIVETEIMTEEIAGADAIRASYNMKDVKKVRPINIGAGISYLVSVLIMCLSAPENGIIVIENPEIHLHPTAQAKVCEFLYFVACSGRQLFVETHSDHIFNGFRVGLANQSMDAEKVNIQYTYLNQGNTTESMKVEVGKYGNIRNQREGLFDQFDIDMNRMLGI